MNATAAGAPAGALSDAGPVVTCEDLAVTFATDSGPVTASMA